MNHDILPGTPETPEIAKAQAKRLAKALEPRLRLQHGQALELVARTHGQETWGHLYAALANMAPQTAGPVIIGGETLSHAFARTRRVISGEGAGVLLADIATALLISAMGRIDPSDVIPEMTEGALRARIATAKTPAEVVKCASGGVTEALIDALHLAPRRELPVEMVLGLSAARRAFGLFADEVPIEKDETLFDGRHSAVFGAGNQGLRAAAEARGLGFHDLTGRAWDISGLEAVMGVPASPVRLVDPLDALRRVCSLSGSAAKRPKRQVVVVGIPRHAVGMDVMFAQARSVGLHLCVRPDREMVAAMGDAVRTSSWILLNNGVVLRE